MKQLFPGIDQMKKLHLLSVIKLVIIYFCCEIENDESASKIKI